MAEYITPTIEQDPEDLEPIAWQFLETVEPGFDPYDGNLEAAIVQACARIIAEIAVMCGDVPYAIFRVFGQLVGTIPDEATAATGSVTFTMIDNAGYTIDAGTTMSLAATGDRRVAFATVEDVTIAPASTVSASTAIVALEEGVVTTGLSGVPLLETSNAFVSSIALVGSTSGGQDAELDEVYLNRLRSRLQLLSSSFVLARDAAILARDVAGVDRAVAIDNYDADHNTLTANQASLEVDTTGWAAGTNCTIARSIAHAIDGTASLELSSTAGGDMTATTTTGTGGEAVNAGVTYTARAQAKAGVSARSVTAGIVWYTAAGAVISTSLGAAVADSAANFDTAIDVTAAAPATAAFAAVQVKVAATGAASEEHYFDRIAFREGKSTAWKAGGTAATGAERMIAVCAIDTAGVTVGDLVQTEIAATLEALREVNFRVHVLDPTSNSIDIAFTAVCYDAYEPADVQTRALAAITAFLSPADWGQPRYGDERDWELIDVVRYLEVAEALQRVDGLDYITSLTVNGAGANVTMVGAVPLPAAGTVTGTVTAP